MSANIVGKDNVQPYKFSQCSRLDYHKQLERSHGLCLFNRPNEVSVRARYLNLTGSARSGAQHPAVFTATVAHNAVPCGMVQWCA